MSVVTLFFGNENALGGREHMFYALLYDFQVTVMSQRVKFKSNTCISLERMGRKARGLKDV